LYQATKSQPACTIYKSQWDNSGNFLCKCFSLSDFIFKFYYIILNLLLQELDLGVKCPEEQHDVGLQGGPESALELAHYSLVHPLTVATAV
jgi:hypothetical protein